MIIILSNFTQYFDNQLDKLALSINIGKLTQKNN
jgi:hypothetical protein